MEQRQRRLQNRRPGSTENAAGGSSRNHTQGRCHRQQQHQDHHQRYMLSTTQEEEIRKEVLHESLRPYSMVRLLYACCLVGALFLVATNLNLLVPSFWPVWLFACVSVVAQSQILQVCQVQIKKVDDPQQQQQRHRADTSRSTVDLPSDESEEWQGVVGGSTGILFVVRHESDQDVEKGDTNENRNIEIEEISDKESDDVIVHAGKNDMDGDANGDDEDEDGVIWVPTPGRSTAGKFEPNENSNEGHVDVEAPSALCNDVDVTKYRARARTCNICLSELNAFDEVSWSANSACPHVFHTSCVHSWLAAAARKHSRRHTTAGAGRVFLRQDPITNILAEVARLPCPCCRRPFLQPHADVEAPSNGSTIVATETETQANAVEMRPTMFSTSESSSQSQEAHDSLSAEEGPPFSTSSSSLRHEESPHSASCLASSSVPHAPAEMTLHG